MANKDWVSSLIEKLNETKDGVLEVKIGGQPVVTQIGDGVKKYIIENADMLRRIGLDTFRSFLVLLHEKKEAEAFNMLLSKMNADDIINRMASNAEELKKQNELRDKFIASLQKFAEEVLLKIAAKALLGVLIAL